MTDPTSVTPTRDPGLQLTWIHTLGGDHRQRLLRAIRNVLRTSIAETTLAQIVDGLPVSEVEKDKYDMFSVSLRHPLHQEHQSLCTGAVRKLHEILNDYGYHLEEISLPRDLLLDFQTLPAGSRAFNTRLVELTARAVHQIAVDLHQYPVTLHVDDELSRWQPPKDAKGIYWTIFPQGMPTLFFHQFYTDFDVYPDGISDVVGFWAEARIFGGVVLFDRRDPETCVEANPHDIYFHSDRYEVTYRIYALRDDQRQSLLDLLTAKPPFGDGGKLPDPLPILGNEDNRKRVDPEEPISRTGIYRDPWDRKTNFNPNLDRRVVRSRVMDFLNYNSWEEFQAAVRRGGEMQDEWDREHYPSDDEDDAHT